MSLIMRKSKITIVFFPVLLSTGVLLGAVRSQAEEAMPSFKTEVSYGSENARDPFKSPIQPEQAAQGNASQPGQEVTPPALKVQGIFWGGNFPQAIINDKIVKVGDSVEGAQVVSIDKNSVDVFFVNRQFKLSSPASDNLATSSQQRKKEAVNEK